MARKKKILLVDDIQLFLELEKTFFRREEFELLVAHTGKQALALIRSERPDLVFTDLNMPEMDGDECCHLVKTDPELCKTPIVIVTTAGNEEQQARCRAAGCDEIVLKPVNRSQFLATARRFLDVAERGEPRFEARLRVNYGREEDQVLANYSINVSSGGLFLETSEPLPLESPLVLAFHLPGIERVIHCRGRVAWVNHPDYPKKPVFPPGMGIQLTEISLDDVHAIRDFLKDKKLSPDW